MNIQVARGNDARARLEDQAFRADWSRLCEQCPWSTPFQSSDFCSIWYRIYHERFEPVLIWSTADDGSFAGLLPLAISRQDGGFVAAGAQQAEYQGWVCRPEFGDIFAAEAIGALRDHFPRARLTFQYLPPGTPVDWLSVPAARRTCRLDLHRRPLVRLGSGQEIARPLQQKSKRNSLNRLKKIGPLEFKRVQSVKELAECFDDVICCYDLRQAAVHNVAPFWDDGLKKPFHLALMQVPSLLHVTVLKFGTEVAAAHIGVCGKKEVHLGIVAYNPFLGKHSPGTFHTLFLARTLREEGFEQLDLTPGDDPHKDHLTNGCDEVYRLTVFSSPGQQARENICAKIKAAVTTTLKTVRIDPQRARSLADRVRRLHYVRTPRSVIRGAREWISRRREMRIYSYAAGSVPEFDAAETIRRDALADLLCYPPVMTWPSRQRFLSSALARIENGQHVYTSTDNACLVHYGWLIPQQDRLFAREVGLEVALPPNSACLFDFWTFPPARGRGLYTLGLRRALSDAAGTAGTERIFVCVLADNGPSRHVIEKVGFNYEFSLFERVRFGRPRRWQGNVAPGEGPPVSSITKA